MESIIDATSPDYMMNQQNSLETSHDNFRNQQETQPLQQMNSIPKEDHLGGISQTNPLTAISNQNGAQDLLRIGNNDNRKSLSSAALRVTFENDRRNQPSSSFHQTQSSMFPHHKPPLFQLSNSRNQMMRDDNSPSNNASSLTQNAVTNPFSMNRPNTLSAISGASRLS